ncbi:hypothetical protein CORT_0A03000 [Candida orthopsilosis Co 90-125]|uniref:Uncharacterized protein n=1 Tax=Candida orthopsilosis (strain 90-125) TaxID=1136231 RepID=H8WW65_CANO9|nr:hypothetical protein CORT_0A03000 [Candida orthopsilosis Co 90-125]CCG20689.1 hypothetical protein CORT_0A03000 [Candida orthopsilosis Co 90-125]
MATCKYTWSANNADDWVLKLGFVGEGFAASTSSGDLFGYSLQNVSTPIINIKSAHETSINDMKVIDDNLIATCSTDGIKVWDVRVGSSQATLGNGRSNFLSLASRGNLLAGGTELLGADAEVHIWDLRNSAQLVKSFVDSHHDDVTALEFHPTFSNYLMSGSTDGYVNIYDLSKSDEDEALHQVINFGSVHSCHFVTESRISVLTHIETLLFHDLNDTNYEELVGPKHVDKGDLREQWVDNEYVIDISPSGFAAYGANSLKKLSIIPFNPKKEKFKDSKSISFPGGHSEEVVRDVLIKPNTTQCLTCGEDGKVKLWELPGTLKYYSIGSTPPVSISKTKNKSDTKKHHKKPHKNKSRRFNPY